jgi:hypothetical protein
LSKPEVNNRVDDEFVIALAPTDDGADLHIQLKRPLPDLGDLSVVNLISSIARADAVEAVSKMPANKKHRGKVMLDFPASRTVIDILLPKISPLVAPKSHWLQLF